MKKISLNKTLKLLLFLIGVFAINTFAQADLKNASELIANEQFEQAIEELQQILPEAPIQDEAAIYNAIGWSYQKLGDYQKAEENISQSRQLALDSGDVETATLASNNLGIIAYLQNDLEKARVLFSQESSRDTKTAQLYLKLIEAKRKELLAQEALTVGIEKRLEKDFAAAAAEYDKALVYQPKNAAALEYKGYALLRNGDYVAALEALIASKEIDATRKFVHLNLAKVNCQLGSEQGLQQVVETSGLSEEQFIDWHQIDGEFRRMCKSSAYIKNLVN